MNPLIYRFFENKEMQVVERIQLEMKKESSNGNSKIYDNHKYHSDIDIPVTEDSIKECEKESIIKAVNDFEDITIVSTDVTEPQKNADADPKLITVKNIDTTTELTNLTEINKDNLKNSPTKYNEGINSSLPFHGRQDRKPEQTNKVTFKESIQKKLLSRNNNSSKSRRTEIIERFKSLKRLSKPLENLVNKEKNSQCLEDNLDEFTDKRFKDLENIDNIKTVNKFQNISKDPDRRFETADDKSKDSPLGNQNVQLEDGDTTGSGATDPRRKISQKKSNEKRFDNFDNDPYNTNRRRTDRNRHEQPNSDMFRWHPMDNDMVWIPAFVPG